MLAHLKSISNHPFRRDDEKGLGSTKNRAKHIFSYNCQVFVHCALQCAMCSMRPPSFSPSQIFCLRLLHVLHHLQLVWRPIKGRVTKWQSYIYENCFDCREQTNPMYDPRPMQWWYRVAVSCSPALLPADLMWKWISMKYISPTTISYLATC